MNIRTLEELEIELEIDEGNLDEEQTKNSQLFYEASKGYAQAFANADGAKMILEKIEAELSKEFKENALSTDSKVTVKDVENYVKSSPAYLTQRQLQIDMEKIELEWKGLMNSFNQRGNRLGDLVDLTKMGYYNSGLLTSNDTIKEKYMEARKAYKKEKE